MGGRKLHKLTARTVESAKEGRHADGGGLYLNVAPTRKSWVFVYVRNGRRREMGFGPVASVSLAEARRKAEEARRQLADGIDPLDAKREVEREKRTPTFGEWADEFIASMEPSWRNPKHRDQWKMTLSRVRDDDGKLVRSGYCLPIINKRVDEVTTEDVLTILKPIWSTKNETASRVRSRIEAVLDAAKAAGHRDGPNPALWRGHLALLLPPRKKLHRGHHPAMDYRDVPAFVAKLREAKGVGAMALEFLILTAARSGKVRGATWAEINIAEKLWTVPADRMKANRVHRVPLTGRALAILEQAALLRRPAAGDDSEALLFPSARVGRPLSDMTLTAAMRRLGAGDYTAHGFRSSFRDWAGDCTAFPREVAEAALAHRSGDKVEQAYRRSDALEKRKKLMEAWDEYLARPAGGNVVPIRQRKATSTG
ncbi:tyrosine-type recombinase/integrase [Daeguia caeni]|uniref:Tyrosine-type recombinase/integrase n=1 Tax=Daeguia caeni TaxID=439612 RepID=A0ABV9H544_9HYPH